MCVYFVFHAEWSRSKIIVETIDFRAPA